MTEETWAAGIINPKLDLREEKHAIFKAAEPVLKDADAIWEQYIPASFAFHTDNVFVQDVVRHTIRRYQDGVKSYVDAKMQAIVAADIATDDTANLKAALVRHYSGNSSVSLAEALKHMNYPDEQIGKITGLMEKTLDALDQGLSVFAEKVTKMRAASRGRINLT